MKKIVFFLLALGIGIYFYQQQKPTITPTLDPNPTSAAVETTQEKINAQLVLTSTQNGQTALELLEANAEIKTKDYGDVGMMVIGIDNIDSDNEHYWAFYINNEYAQQSASKTILESGDIVKFIYEEIKQAEF
jgi:hypothetical protein